MAIETDADRAQFVDPDEFGEAFTWTVGAVVSTVTGVPDTGTIRIEGQEGPGILTAHASLLCRAVDIPTGAAAGDAVSSRSVAHTVRSIEPDGTGMTVVRLERTIED